MKLKIIEHELSVCRLKSAAALDWDREFYFVGKTDEELSLVCPTGEVPPDTDGREDGWRAFRIQGVLDFSLTGILAPIAQIMADNRIGIFAVSTFNTDYVLIKKENFERAVGILRDSGYEICA